MGKIRVIFGFTDNKTKANYQDNEIIENKFNDARYEELKTKGFIEDYEEPIVEGDNSELLDKIKELEKALEDANAVPKTAKALKEANEKLTLELKTANKEIEELNSKVAELEKALETPKKGDEANGEVQE